jgi:putative transposase
VSAGLPVTGDFRSQSVIMPRRTTPLISGEYYHVYNRGNNRQDVFFERRNYLLFLWSVRKYLLNATDLGAGVTIVAYCLMPNHFHLLMHLLDDHFSRRMQRLSISFTKALNTRYNRVGALFQGQFQAILVDTDEYLLHLSRYIHLNPVAAGLVARPQDWDFSSYREYTGTRSGTLVTPDIVLGQFGSRAEYSRFVDAYKPVDHKQIKHLLFDE